MKDAASLLTFPDFAVHEDEPRPNAVLFQSAAARGVPVAGDDLSM